MTGKGAAQGGAIFGLPVDLLEESKIPADWHNPG